MFDREKLAHWLDSLQVETHFPGTMPQKMVELPRSALDVKMDRYDIFRQSKEDYQSAGTAEYPVLVPWRMSPFNNPMYMPMGYITYGGISRSGVFNSWVTGAAAPTDENGDVAASSVPVAPIETPYDRLKKKLARLAGVSPAQVADPAPPSLGRAPDYTHTITAWRGWECANGELGALGSYSKWEPRRAYRANCRAGRNHAAPHLNCGCGYWSFKTRELLEQALETYAVAVDVIGQVEIWGRVIECENGWRSEFAYPKELWLLDEGSESLSWRYGVPVRRLE